MPSLGRLVARRAWPANQQNYACSRSDAALSKQTVVNNTECRRPVQSQNWCHRCKSGDNADTYVESNRVLTDQLRRGTSDSSLTSLLPSRATPGLRGGRTTEDSAHLCMAPDAGMLIPRILRIVITRSTSSEHQDAYRDDISMRAGGHMGHNLR